MKPYSRSSNQKLLQVINEALSVSQAINELNALKDSEPICKILISGLLYETTKIELEAFFSKIKFTKRRIL